MGLKQGSSSTCKTVYFQMRLMDQIKQHPKDLTWSRENPNLREKNQKLGTIVHVPARMDAILKKILPTLQAASAYTHFRGGVMGSNADFMENGFKPKEYVYPSNSSKIKNWHETFINPTRIHAYKTPGMFFHPASIGGGPRPPGNLQNHEKSKFVKFGPPGGPRCRCR